MSMKDGDYIPDGSGGFVNVAGAQALLQRVLFLLTARRGSFPFLPDLGSDLYLLPRAKASARAALAQEYAARALEKEEGLSVTGAELIYGADGALAVRVMLAWHGEGLAVTAETGGYV